MRDFYEVLGVAKDADNRQIKKAYHRLAMKYHPDQNPDDPDAEEKFKEASNAYAVLSDQEKRARYDRFGHEGLGGAAQGFGGVDDIFSAFGDIFGDFFGGGGRRRAVRRGSDIRVDVQLTFAEAVWGVSKDVEVRRSERCGTCEGSGTKSGKPPATCSTCGGKGQVVHAQGFFMIQSECPQCRGEGTMITDPCPTCSGRRVEAKTSTLSVTVPPGIDDSQTLRLAGKGEVAPGGGPPGNLYVVIHVEPDERFHREDENVLSEIPISFVTAALGGEVEVPTLEEHCTAYETVEVKPGTQPGDVVVRRGQGIPRVNRRSRGDHVVQFKVDVPKKLTARQEELLREFAAESGAQVREKRGIFERFKR